MRTAFENYLIKKGFNPHSYNFKTKQLEPTDKIGYSSMGILRLVYINPSDPDFKVYFGLNQKGFSPTLIEPRPKVEILKRNDEGFLVVQDQSRDSIMISILEKESFDDILEAMRDRTIIFKYDLTKETV